MPSTQPTPKLEIIREGIFPKYKLLEDYKFQYRRNGRDEYFIIPAGFVYDGATFGSFLFWRKSLHKTPETLAHDYLYIMLGDVSPKYMNHAPAENVSKRQADKIFMNGARRITNVQGWRAAIASGAIKTVGTFLWYRRKLVNLIKAKL